MTNFKPGDRVYDIDLGYESAYARATILEPANPNGEIHLRFDAGAWSDVEGTNWPVHGLRHLPGYEPETKTYRVQAFLNDSLDSDLTAEELAEMLCGGVWTLVNSHTGQEFKVVPL